ncbi:ComEA family DNA-binding protein [Marinobacteraceae bacterium S3BR75-40.1]
MIRNIRSVFSVLVLIFVFSAGLQAAETPTTVNINEATPAQMAEVLDGVGPAKAAAIVEYRESHGPFKAVGGITKVKGIGEATLEKNRASIKLQ